MGARTGSGARAACCDGGEAMSGKTSARLEMVEIIAYGDGFGWMATVRIETEFERQPRGRSWWERLIADDLIDIIEGPHVMVDHVEFESGDGVTWKRTDTGVPAGHALEVEAGRVVRHLKRIRRGVWREGDKLTTETTAGAYR